MKNTTKITLVALSQLVIDAGVWLVVTNRYIIGTIILMIGTMSNQIFSQIEGVL